MSSSASSPAAREASFETLATRVEATERAALLDALATFEGNLSASARALDIDRNTLKRKLDKYALR